MKIVMLCLALLSFLPLRAQEDERWEQFADKAEQDAEEYVRGQIEAGRLDTAKDSLQIILIKDTMRIEQAVRYFSDVVKTTAEMRSMNSFQLDEYDKLLNKYYNRLRSKLTVPQREALLKAQREWLKFRDAKGDFIYELIINEYGTLGPVLIGSDCVELLKERVFELFSYLQEITN